VDLFIYSYLPFTTALRKSVLLALRSVRLITGEKSRYEYSRRPSGSQSRSW